MNKLPCIYYFDNGEIGYQPRCLRVNTITKAGEMEARVCEDVLREGICPKGKTSLSAKEKGMAKKFTNVNR